MIAHVDTILLMICSITVGQRSAGRQCGFFGLGCAIKVLCSMFNAGMLLIGSVDFGSNVMRTYFTSIFQYVFVDSI